MIPKIVELNATGVDAFIAYYRQHEAEIDGMLKSIGTVKFRGVHISSLEDFQHIVDSISSRFLSYIDGNSPRTKLSANVYTSTEYDQTQKITMHNELSYSAKWPNRLFFSCLQPADSGGETLLADSRAILAKMNRNIVSEIEAKGITYIRNLHGGGGFGPSWQDTFETENRETLETYCSSFGIRYEWTSEGHLKLKQYTKGISEHRETKEKIWFNQIDQFHPAHLGQEMYDGLQILYEKPENFPMYVTFGDGTPISQEMVQEILVTIDGLTIAPEWRNNELLIVDNELVCHGRNPFTGHRKVVVAMSE